MLAVVGHIGSVLAVVVQITLHFFGPILPMPPNLEQ